MKNKKRTNKKEYENRAIAFSEIFILVLATIAFSWMIGGDIEEVSAAVGDACKVCYGYNTLYSGTLNDAGACIANGALASITCEYGCDSLTNGCKGGPENQGTTNIGKELLNKAINIGEAKLTETVTKKGFWTKLKGFFGGGKTGATGGGTSGATNPNAIQPYSGTVANPKTTLGDWVNPFGGGSGVDKFSAHLSNIFNTVLWAGVVATIVTIFAKKVSSARNAKDMTTVAWVGVGIAFAYAVALEAGLISSGPVGWIGAVIVAAAVGIYMLIGYQIYSRIIFTYRPLMWQPPEGGADCNKCNLLKIKGTDEKACSEYVCHSYGKNCGWVNNGTMYETCVQKNANDRQAPVITPVKNIYEEDVFSNSNYDYTKTQLGSKIIYKGTGAGAQQCIPVFTSVLIAFTTDEPADCRVSTEEKTGISADVFTTMKTLTEAGASTFNHTLLLSPMITMSDQAAADSGYTLTNNGIFKYYIKCQDDNGNINAGYYLIDFCTQKSDKQPPEIKSTSPTNGSYIAYGTQKIDSFKVYLNEPAECKWDTKKQPYSQMTHNFDKCYTSLNNLLDGKYGCNTSLSGGFVYGPNIFYVACVDKPGETERNAGNTETIIFKGTRRLIITDVKINEKPNGTVIISGEDPTEVNFSVTTYGGAEEGKALCMYTSDGKSFSMFNNDGVRDYLTTNTESLYLSEGIHNYSIHCEDIAGNLNSTFINFSVKLDTLPPTVVRAYNDNGYLKLITDEEAECVYTLDDCIYEFEDGTEIDTEDGIEHNIEWNTENSFYVKCMDQLGRYPGATTCSIEVKPFEIANQV